MGANGDEMPWDPMVMDRHQHKSTLMFSLLEACIGVGILGKGGCPVLGQTARYWVDLFPS